MTNYVVRLAKETDIESLVTLNEKWQLSEIPPEAKSKGFLSAKFSTENFMLLTNYHEIVVSEVNGKLAGYYLLNNFCENQKIKQGRLVISKLINKNIIPAQAKIALGAQVLVDIEYQQKGLFSEMLNFLCGCIYLKYDFLYSSISKENQQSIIVHKKRKWEVMAEDEFHYFVMLDIRNMRIWNSDVM